LNMENKPISSFYSFYISEEAEPFDERKEGK
jgi:hypothetical protein